MDGSLRYTLRGHCGKIQQADTSYTYFNKFNLFDKFNLIYIN